METQTIDTTDSKNLSLDEDDHSQIPFERLVETVDSHLLFVQLMRIFNFLKSDKTELTFPDISSHMGSLLVQIVQNKDNLYCLLHHSEEKCRKVAEEVIDKLKETEYIYNLVPRLDCSIESKGLLAYFKLCPNEMSASNSYESVHTGSGKESRPLSQSSSSEAKTTKKGQTANNKFKRKWLLSTLAFVKDKTQLCHQYWDMSMEQIEFVCSLFWDNKSWIAWRTKMVDFLPLWEAMEIIGLKYDFRLTFVDVYTTDAAWPDLQVSKVMRSPLRLMLEKVPKSKSKNEELDDSTDVKRKVSEDFMKMASQTILDFLADEYRASLIFEGMKSIECLFLQCVMKSTKPIFPGHEVLLEYVERNRYTQNYEVKIDVGRLNRKTRLKNVMFLKEVNYDTTYMKKSLNRYKEITSFPGGNQLSPTVTNQWTDVNESNRDRSSRNKDCNEFPVVGLFDPSDPDSNRPVEDELGNKMYRYYSNQEFPTVGMFDPSNPDGDQRSRSARRNRMPDIVHSNSTRNNRPGDAVDHREIPNRKVRLLEAMSVPIDSDKAKRMMQSMGWNGGPLGRRGEGITEPIIPQLHLVSGAGLGHKTKPIEINRSRPTSKNRMRTPENSEEFRSSSSSPIEDPQSQKHIERFRIGIFMNVLDLLEGEQKTKIVRFKKQLYNKEKSFIERFAASLNKRERLIFRNEQEIEFMTQVLDIMNSDEDLGVTQRVSDDRMSVILMKVSKEKIRLQNSKSAHNKELFLRRNSDGKWSNMFPKISGLTQSKYLYNLKAFLLLNILDFLKNKKQKHKELLFEGKLCDTKCKHVKAVVDSVNERFKHFEAKSDLEKELVNDISMCCGNNTIINVEFSQLDRVCFLMKLVSSNEKSCHTNIDTTDAPVKMNDSITNVQKTNTMRKPDGEVDSPIIDSGSRGNVDDDENTGYVQTEVPELKNIIINTSTSDMKRNVSVQSVRDNLSYKICVNNAYTSRKKESFKCIWKEITLPSITQKNKKAFRIGLYQSYLELLDCAVEQITISYKNRLTVRNMSFLKHFSSSLNNRYRLTLEAPDEVHLVEKLIELMHNNRDVMVIASVDSGHKELTLIKVTIDFINKPSHVCPLPERKQIKKDTWGTRDNTIQPQFELNKQPISFTFKFFVLMNILEFLKCDTDVRELFFADKITKTERKFASNLVNMIRNDICQSNNGTQFENAIVSSIREIIENVNVECNIDDSGRKCILKKIYIPKQEIESNRISPTNATIHNNDNSNTHESDAENDEIEIIEELESIIILSDSEEPIELKTSNSNEPIESIIPNVAESVDDPTIDSNRCIINDNTLLESANSPVRNTNRSSYSDEFDKDLNDLEKVISEIDDDVFTDELVNKECNSRENCLIDRPASTKRSRSDSTESLQEIFKKTKLFNFKSIKKVSIVPTDYPEKKITRESLMTLQTIISESIDKEEVLPLLQCHGLQDGALVYACHNEKSFFFLENSLNSANDYKIIDNDSEEEKCYNMKIKMNTLFQDLSKICSRLELYNTGLNTENWGVTDVKTYDNSIVIYVDVDRESYEYICDNNFCLYAGVDIARFSVVWK